ncbi:MAG: hypothetical protein RQ751_10095 [Longimicrobiales bacterium]|nr:hypothetical protein [Longimicrobiales bacterium]
MRPISTPLGFIAWTVLSWTPLAAQIPGVKRFVPAVQFVEEARWVAPEGYEVSGVGFAPEGYVVWSRESSEAHLLSWDMVHRGSIEMPLTGPPLAVAQDSAGNLQVLSRDPARILHVAPDGSQAREDLLPVDLHLIHGDFDGRVWFVASSVTGPEGPWVLQVLIAERAGLTVEDVSDQRFTAPTIFAREGTAYVSETRRPHTITVVGAQDAMVRGAPRAGLLDTLSIAAQAGPSDGWNAVRVLPLDTGFLQTIADPTSIWRTVVVYDTSGRPYTNPIFRGAFGFVRSDPEAQRIIAVLRLNRSEVVQYRWRWNAP